MQDHYTRLLEMGFENQDGEGSSKVTSLSEAVSRLIRPGMTIHTGITHILPYALCNQVARQFQGTRPGFHLVTLGAVNHALTWIHLGLVKRLTTSYCGDIYPAPGPSPVAQRQIQAGEIVVEDWSLLTLVQRLMAGSLGLAFMPTRSLVGSGMAEENSPTFSVVADPATGRDQGVVSALQPDITLLHAWAADPQGNALFTGPYSEGLWGAMASREGVILSVEQVVSPDSIRRHSNLVRLPGRFVRAVCPAPFGGHPGGLADHGLEGFEGYAEDYEFIVSFREASRSPGALDGWLERWVLGLENHAGYLGRLGPERLQSLKNKARPDAWRHEMDSLLPGLEVHPQPTPQEWMVITAARRLADRIKERGYDTILAGIGTSNLAAWLAHGWLRQEAHPVDLVAEVGFYGYQPRPGSPFIFNFANIPTCKMQADSLTTLGILVGGTNARCIGILGAGQVDRLGCINSTKVPGVTYLVGSGGANDVASTAGEVLVTLPAIPFRLVEKVPYVTAPGDRVRLVVTDKGVFEKEEGIHQLRLTAVIPDDQVSDRATLVRSLKEICGFSFDVAEPVVVEPPPRAEEIALLRLFDPRRNFLGKI